MTRFRTAGIDFVGENGEFDGGFTLETNGIIVPDGAFHLPGDTLQVQYEIFGFPLGREVTFVGFEDGTLYPVFESGNFGSDGHVRIIATNEDHGPPDPDYMPGALLADIPYTTDITTICEFSNLGWVRVPDGNFNPETLNHEDLSFRLQGEKVRILDGTYDVDDILGVSLIGAGIPRVATFLGYESDTFYPIFHVDEFLGTPGLFIATNERGGPGSAYGPGEVVIDTPYTPDGANAR